MFWKRKTSRAVVSEDRPTQVPAAEPTNNDFACVYCQSDVRRETVLAVRRLTTFFAMWPSANGKPATLGLDDQQNDQWTGRYICTSCALNRDIPGLDKDKLRSLLTGLQNANPAKH
jgi:hypothetical protein